MKKVQWKTAEQFMAGLEQDPEYVARMRARDERRARREAKYAELDRPLIDALSRNGFAVSSLEQLLRDYSPLPESAVAAILSQLRPGQDDRHCEGLVRALGAASAPFDGRVLAAIYEATSDESLRWAIANTIALVRPHSLDEWIANASDGSSLKQALEKLGYW